MAFTRVLNCWAQFLERKLLRRQYVYNSDRTYSVPGHVYASGRVAFSPAPITERGVTSTETEAPDKILNDRCRAAFITP